MLILIKNEINENYRKKGLLAVFFLFFVFAILIGFAILKFPDKYDFFTSYLSELGVTTTIHGFANPTSSILFKLAMMDFGLLSAVFWIFGDNILRFKILIPIKFEKIISIGSLSGFLSAIPSFLIGVFPFDYQNPIHIFLAWIYFALTGIACLSYASLFIYQFYKEQNNENIWLNVIISEAIPVLGGLILRIYIQNSTLLLGIPILVIFLILNFVLARKFKSLLSYVSYITSFSLFPVVVYIIIALLLVGFTPEVEVSTILSIMIFLLVINLQLLNLNKIE